MKSFGSTNIGLVRKSNQDSYVIVKNEVDDLLVVVCDGVGGSKSGDIASEYVTKYFSANFSGNHGFNDRQELLDWIKKHVNKVNDEVFVMAKTSIKYTGMGTTMVALLVTSVGNYIINIGDSRAYALFDNGDFKQLSEDHTIVQEMLNRNEITKEMAKNHSQKNYITNAVGVWEKLRIDIFHIVEPVTTFLLCTDGLHGYVDDLVIKKIMCDKMISAKDKQKALMDQALKSGGKDNITIVVIDL